MPIDANGQWFPSVSKKQAELLAESKHLIVDVEGPRKSSKCVAADTIILKDDGPTRIGTYCQGTPPGEFKVNNGRVVSYGVDGSDFSIQDCPFTYHNESTAAIRVKLTTGLEITGSPNHPVLTERNGDIGYRMLSELTVNDWIPTIVGCPSCLDEWKERSLIRLITFPDDKSKLKSREIYQKILIEKGKHPSFSKTCKAVGSCFRTVKSLLSVPPKMEPESILIDDDLGYWIGALVGDGCCVASAIKSKRAIGFSNIDMDLLSEMDRISRWKFGVPIQHDSRCDYSIHSPVAIAVVKLLGINKYAHEKRVPNEIVNSRRSVVASFLSGLFDTDGSSDSNGHVTFSSASHGLALDVQVLLMAFGIQASLKTYQNSNRGYSIVSLGESSHIFYKEIGFKVSRKQVRGLNLRTSPSIQSMCVLPKSSSLVLKKWWGMRKEKGLVGVFDRKTRKLLLESFHRGNRRRSTERLVFLKACLKCFESCEDLPYVGHCFLSWRQVESISNVEADLYDISVDETHSFVGNSMVNHNTVGSLHRFARHLWECPNARAAMAGRTLTDNYDGGTWQLMVEHILPEWIGSGIGMDWHTPPKLSSLTHKMECAVTNVHGGVSRLQLDSLKNEREVERIYKGRYYSAIYMTEAANFKRRASFEIMLQCLRGFDASWKDHFLFLIDTNPAEEGQSHWIYQLFHVFRRMTRKQIEEQFPHTVEAMVALRDKLAIYRFAVADNPWLTDLEKQELEAQFMLSGPDVYARHWLGEWKASASDTAFARVWRPEIHIQGEMATVADPNPAILMPESDCITLYTGWDLGDIHNAIVIAEKVMAGKPGEEQPVFKILDELVMIDTPIKLEDLTLEFMDLMRYWENVIGRKVNWVHWSDSSAMSGFQSISASNEAKEVFRASDQAIELQGVTKGPNSVVKRIQLTRRLLFANRLFISSRCEQLIQTMTMLKTNAQGSLKRSGEPLRHAFDAMSYLIAMEAWSELVMDIENRLAKPGNPIIHT